MPRYIPFEDGLLAALAMGMVCDRARWGQQDLSGLVRKGSLQILVLSTLVGPFWLTLIVGFPSISFISVYLMAPSGLSFFFFLSFFQSLFFSLSGAQVLPLVFFFLLYHLFFFIVKHRRITSLPAGQEGSGHLEQERCKNEM